jgi:hypothetical protein
MGDGRQVTSTDMAPILSFPISPFPERIDDYYVICIFDAVKLYGDPSIEVVLFEWLVKPDNDPRQFHLSK